MPFSSHAAPVLVEAVARVAPGAEILDPPASGFTEEQQEAVLLLVAASLFGRGFDDGKALRAFLNTDDEARDDENKNVLNEAMLPFDGFGRDCFMLNELFPDDADVRSFSTLGDYDRADFEEKEGLRVEEGLPTQAYGGYLLRERARWIDGGLVYGRLSTALQQIREEMHGLADDLAEARWPTVFEEGPEDGEVVGHIGSVRLLRHDVRRVPLDNAAKSDLAHVAYFTMIESLAADEWKRAVEQAGDWVWRDRRVEGGDVDEDLVFSGPAAIASVRLSHWLEDLALLPDGEERYADLHAAAAKTVREGLAKILDAVDDAFVLAQEWSGDVSDEERKARMKALVFGAVGIDPR